MPALGARDLLDASGMKYNGFSIEIYFNLTSFKFILISIQYCLLICFGNYSQILKYKVTNYQWRAFSRATVSSVMSLSSAMVPSVSGYWVTQCTSCTQDDGQLVFYH